MPVRLASSPLASALVLLVLCAIARPAVAQDDASPEPLNVIAIFAHPDDGEYKMGGTAALLAERGHRVKFVSLTNGDAGHHEMGGGALAKRRRAEAKEARRRLGIAAYDVLDYHDAELMPTLEVRKDVIRLIREWDADVVIGLRPYDYHPDHRNAGRVVQDAAYMVQVPNVHPRIPPTDGNPVFLYMQDRFTTPYPFQPDVAVAVDGVVETKAAALDAHESQMYEWLPWVAGTLDEVPDDADARMQMMMDRVRSGTISDDVRGSLATWYGDSAADVEVAEAFEITEYGRQPSEAFLQRLFFE